MHKQFYISLAGAMVIFGCNNRPPPTPQLPKPIQQLPSKVELPNVQELMDTAEKEFAPVDPPSVAPTPAASTEE